MAFAIASNGALSLTSKVDQKAKGADQMECRPRAVMMNNTGWVRVRLLRSHSQSPIKEIITKTKTKTNWNPSSSC